MAYKRTSRRRASSSRRAPVRRRAPARRAPARKLRGRSSRSVSRPQTIKIVIEHATQAGEGMAGMSLPQIAGQSKKAKF